MFLLYENKQSSAFAVDVACRGRIILPDRRVCAGCGLRADMDRQNRDNKYAEVFWNRTDDDGDVNARHRVRADSRFHFRHSRDTASSFNAVRAAAPAAAGLAAFFAASQ